MRLALGRESKSAAESLWRDRTLPVRTCRLPLGLSAVPPGPQGRGAGLSAVWVGPSSDP